MSSLPVEFDLLRSYGSGSSFDGVEPSEVDVPSEVCEFGSERTRPRPDDLSFADAHRECGLAASAAPLASHVGTVGLIVSDEEVIGPDTQRNVALVKNLQALRYRPEVDLVGQAVNLDSLLFPVDGSACVTVTFLSLVSSPKPTAIGLVDVFPELDFRWYAGSSHSTSRVVSVRVARSPHGFERPAYFITETAA